MVAEKVESSVATAKKEMAPQNKRRKELGIEVHNFDGDSNYFFSADDSRYIRGLTTELDLEKRFQVGSGHFERSDRMNLLRRSKLFLARRSFADLSEENRPKLYGAKNKIETVLDCFPSVKYSYSSSLPPKVVMRNHGIPEDFYGHRKPNEVRYFDVCCAPDGSSKKARMSDVSRSANIRLDPMDAPRQLFIYRCRIRRCITWGYSVGLVPIMMTLTIFHRWNPLRGLLRVLSRSWDRFFASGRPAVTRTKQMGVQAYIRRLEETITDGKDTQGYNSGWHPHYHVILFVSKDKLSLISDMEEELQEAWFEIVNHFFAEEFGEEIDPSYASSFKKHGLVFSRYSDVDLKSSARKKSRCVRFAKKRKNGKRPIRPVDDSDYMAKTVGCDPKVLYTGESEMTSIHAKNSRIPFDLLCDDTAGNNDLWVEYALATKGLRSFVFSRGLGGRVRDYFEAHPERDSVKSFVKSDKVVAQLENDAYRLLYRACKVDEMLRVAVRGYDSLCDWFKDFYLKLGYSVDEITDEMLPLPPNTCSPFGDTVDVLTFVKRAKDELKVKVPHSSSRDGAVRAEKKSNTKRPRDAKNFNESTTSAMTSTQTQPQSSEQSASPSSSAAPPASIVSFASTLVDESAPIVVEPIESSVPVESVTPLSTDTVSSPLASVDDFPLASAPPVSSQSSDEDSLDEDVSDVDADSEAVDSNEDLPDAGVVLDSKTKYIRMLKHISDARVTLSLCEMNVSAETLEIVETLLKSQLEVALSDSGAKPSELSPAQDTISESEVDDFPTAATFTDESLDFDDVWISSESYDPFGKFDDNSLDARYAEVSTSKWYPDWYKQRLKNLKANADCAAANARPSMPDDVTFAKLSS